jgi:hypothetical protein
MAALTATSPANTGTTVAGAAVAASDTIAQSVMGGRGCFLEILNASGSTDNVVISDAGNTPAGNPQPGGLLPLVAVGAGTNKIFSIRPEQVGSNGLVTITHSQTATVTYKLYPVP